MGMDAIPKDHDNGIKKDGYPEKNCNSRKVKIYICKQTAIHPGEMLNILIYNT